MGRKAVLNETERAFIRQAIDGEIEWMEIPGGRTKDQRHVSFPHYTTLFCEGYGISLTDAIIRGVSEISKDKAGVPTRDVFRSRFEKAVDRWDSHLKVCPILQSEEREEAAKSVPIPAVELSKVEAEILGLVPNEVMVQKDGENKNGNASE
jgi:hypothetical protein